MDRGSIKLPVRLELGGAITRLFEVDLDDPTGGFSADATLPVPGWGSVKLGFDLLGSSTSFSRPTVDTAGQRIDFAFPQGGGISLGPPNTLTDLSYNTDYNEFLVRPSFTFSPRDWQDIRISWRLGGMFGRTHEESTTHFNAANGAANIDVDYTDELSAFRFGALVGTDVTYQLNKRFGFFADTELRFIFNSANGSSSLTAPLTACATGCRIDLSDSSFDVGFRLGGGVNVAINDNVNAVFGGAFETWQAPTMFYPIENTGPAAIPASIKWQRRNSLTVSASVRFELPPGSSGRYTSDRRLKRDIHLLTTLDSGIRLYAFRYLWSEEVRVGVMAQDLLADARYADAAIMTPSGYYVVDYARLGLRMTTLDAWLTEGMEAVLLRAKPEDRRARDVFFREPQHGRGPTISRSGFRHPA